MKTILECGTYRLPLDRTLIMGILNITSDSFYDGGKHSTIDLAIRHAKGMVSDGADIIDVGAESTRPGSKPVNVEDEIDSVIPVIHALAKDTKVPISIDSYKPQVVAKAVDAGASMINDINALRSDGLADIVAKSGLPVIIMHMQGTPAIMQDNPEYEDVILDLLSFFEDRIDYALDQGISQDKIIIDPGIGFGKTTQHNLLILKNIEKFKELGFPLLIGHSRKSFIGELLGLPVEKRLPPTLGVTAYCSVQGVNILRVHDVGENHQIVSLMDDILKS